MYLYYKAYLSASMYSSCFFFYASLAARSFSLGGAPTSSSDSSSAGKTNDLRIRDMLPCSGYFNQSWILSFASFLAFLGFCVWALVPELFVRFKVVLRRVEFEVWFRKFCDVCSLSSRQYYLVSLSLTLANEAICWENPKPATDWFVIVFVSPRLFGVKSIICSYSFMLSSIISWPVSANMKSTGLTSMISLNRSLSA